MKRPKNFTKRKAGEWVQPVMRGFYHKCCDCGLVHRMNFKVIIRNNGVARVLMQAFLVSGGNRPKKEGD